MNDFWTFESPRPAAWRSPSELLSRRTDLDGFQLPMIVAVIPVRMVQMPIDQVIDVIAVGNRIMTTPGAVNMIRGVGAAGMLGRTRSRVFRRHLQPVFLDAAVAADVVQVAVVQVVDVVAVPHARVFAVGAVLVSVMGMDVRHMGDSCVQSVLK